MIRTIELFSGVGAQRMALRNISIPHEVLGVCEIDKFAHKSYETIHGETINFGDITKVESLPAADLWTYSFPCTDLSLAGKGLGLSRGTGTRSGLLWEVERLLNVSDKPKYLLMENVKPLVGKKHKPHFDEWCLILEQMGYKNYWTVLNSKDFNVPQSRERVFMVSIIGDEEFSFPSPLPLENKLISILETSPNKIFYLSDTRKKRIFNRLRAIKPFIGEHIYSPTIISGYHKTPGDGFYVNTSKTFDDLYTDQEKSTIVYEEFLYHNTNSHDKFRKLTPLECWRLMGFTDNDFNKASKVNSNTQLYRQAGNSIVVPVLEGIFRSMFCEDKGALEVKQLNNELF